MSASRGTGSRLSRKRKNEDNTQSQLGSALHDITDDFEDLATVFRVPKKSKVEKLLGPSRSRGRPKRSAAGKSSADKVDDKIFTYDEEDFTDGASGSSSTDKNSQDVVVLEGNDFILELDESFLCKDEKLCGSCKHIVPAAIYSNHLKECLQKFKLTKRDARTAPSASGSSVCGNQEKEKPKEKDTASVQDKENLQVLPCPVCFKLLKSKTQRQSHIKMCAQSHGLSSEKLLLAVRLQEKQAEERNLLGLPPLTAPPSAIHQDKEKEATTSGRPKRRAAGAANSKDPDLAMAIALSRSIAEEEAEKRASREEQLLALGLDQIVEEDRKAKPVVLLQCPKGAQKTSKSRKKGRRNFSNTVLATRSTEDRERIVSEKVATLLTAEVTSDIDWDNIPSRGGRQRLAKFRDESCSLWTSAHSHLERPLEEFYVKELEPYIQPKKAEVGKLLRRLSDIPGRLNVTIMHMMNENSDGGSDEEEESVVDGYCTQLAMAELLGSQELNVTRACGSTKSLDLTSVQDLLEDPAPGPNVTLEAASGFWLVHSEEDEGVQKETTNERSKSIENSTNYIDVESRKEQMLVLEESDTFLTKGDERTSDMIKECFTEKGRNLKEHSHFLEMESKHLEVKENNSVVEVTQTFDIADVIDRESREPENRLHSNTDVEQFDISKSYVSSNKCNSEMSQKKRTVVKDTTSTGSDESDNELLCSKVRKLNRMSDDRGNSQKFGGKSLSVRRYENEGDDRPDDNDKAMRGIPSNDANSCVPKRIEQPAGSDMCEVEDSEILCVLDTSKGGSLSGMLSTSQTSSLSVHSRSQGFRSKLSRFSQQRGSSLRKRTVNSEMQDENDKLSSCSSDSDRTQIFDDEKCDNEQHLTEKMRLSQSNERCKNFHITESDLTSPMEIKKPVIDSESDEGGAKTITYDDMVPHSPSEVSVDEMCPTGANCDLDTTIPFQNQECNIDHNSGGLKNFTAKKDHGHNDLSSSFKNKEKDTVGDALPNSAVDLDETKPYNDTTRLTDTVHYEKESDEMLSEDVSKSCSSDCRDSEKYLGETGDTVIDHILAAFEETNPLEAESRMNDTVLFRNAEDAQETVPYEDSSKFDNTLPHEMGNNLEETLPYKKGIDGEVNDLEKTLPYKEAIDGEVNDLEETVPYKEAIDGEVNDLEETVPYKDPIDGEVNDLEETVPFKEAIDGDETILHQDLFSEDITVLHQNTKDKSQKELERVKDQKTNSFIKLDVAYPVVCDAETKLDKIMSKDSDIQNISMKNISRGQKRSSERETVDEGSESMRARLVYDWSSLLASGEESNVTITVVNGQELSAHAIVLLARCSQLYEEVKSNNKCVTWNEVSYEGAFVFLAYLYTGECSVKTKDDPTWMDVFDLALKYNCEELVNHLESLYKIGNSPVKSKELVTVESEPDFSVPRLLPKSFKFGVSRVLPKSPEIANKVPEEAEISTAPRISLMPIQTSTVIRGGIVPLQASTEIKPSSAIITTPKIDKVPGVGKERIVRRCLDLSPINRTLYAKVNDPTETLESKVIDIKNLQSPENARSQGKTSQLDHVSQSPDLFDSSITIQNISYITTPSKSPMTLPSPQKWTVDTPTETCAKAGVADAEMMDTTPRSPYSSKRSQDLSNNFHKSVVMSQTHSDLGMGKDQGHDISNEAEYHSNDEPQPAEEAGNSKGDGSRRSSRRIDSEEVDGVAAFDEGNGKETEDDNVIDLTNDDSSDNSLSSFPAVAENDIRSVSGANTPDYSSMEEMEPLKLADSEESCKEDDSTTHEKEISNNIDEVMEKGNEIAVDITCPSPKSIVSVHEEDSRSGDLENEENAYISNVWDDFDDIGCGIPIGSPMTPARDVNAESDGNTDLPSVEKKDVQFDDNNQVDINASEISSEVGTSPTKSPELLPTKLHGRKTLCPPTSSKEDDSTTHGKEISNNIDEVMENGDEIAVDITCPSPKSIVSVHEEHSRSGDLENEENAYISNVWDDFDDIGCGIPISSPMTPARNVNAERDGNTDLPSVEKKDVQCDDNNQVDMNASEVSSEVGASPTKSPELLPTKLHGRKTSFPPTTSRGYQQLSQKDGACVKVISSGSAISDSTMMKLREDFNDTGLWRDEFEPVFENEGTSGQETSDKDRAMQGKHAKTPRQKTGARKTVTPMLDYKKMPTPELRQELKKYGIKPISRRKAVTILEHVYEKTHPLVTDSEADSSFCDTPLRPQSSKATDAGKEITSALHKRAVAQNQKKSAKNLGKEPPKVAAVRKRATKTSATTSGVGKKATKPSATTSNIEADDDDDSPLNCSQTSSTSSGGSERDCVEESMLLGIGEDDNPITATQQGDLASTVTQFITSDPEFHRKVLLYEPFFVEDLQAALKANGVKCKMSTILEILDNQCITFRTYQAQRNWQRNRKCKRKSTPGKSPKKAKRGRR